MSTTVPNQRDGFFHIVVTSQHRFSTARSSRCHPIELDEACSICGVLFRAPRPLPNAYPSGADAKRYRDEFRRQSRAFAVKADGIDH